MSEAADAVEETTSSSEDEEPEIDESQDRFFFKTLSCLKNKDPKIYDPSVSFFPKDAPKAKAENDSETPNDSKTPTEQNSKPLFLKDFEREHLLEIMEGKRDHSDDENFESLPYAQQQKSLKASFKAALEESDSESEEGLLVVKTKTKEELEKEEEDYKAWLKGNKDKLEDEETEKELKPLHDYWSKPDLDSNEQFLRDYILNRRYLEEGDEAEDDGISEDGELLEMQERFETEYNMRFENDTNTEIKRYPRQIEGSLRKKDERRKEKRKRLRERKRSEKDKRKQEIAKKQKEKLLEFKEQVEKIKKLTGNDQLGFRDEEIFGDDEFDPEAHDRKMQELYSDAFYSADADDLEKPDFGDDEDIAGPEDAELDMDEPGPDNMDLEAADSKKESRSQKKRKEKKKNKKAFTDIMDIAKPVFDPKVHNSYQKYIDEYYGMDCEDFIEDIPCRFKYRETVPNDYGLTVEEILAADDKELNQWVSSKKITKLRPEHVEKNEVRIYRQKAKDYNLKKKILASVYGSPEGEEEGNEDGRTVEDVPPSKNKRKRPVENVQNDATQPDEAASANPSKKKKSSAEATDNTKKNPQIQISDSHRNGHQNKGKKKKFKGGKNKGPNSGEGKSADPVAQISDMRLKAYDIKPREFKKKMKYKK